MGVCPNSYCKDYSIEFTILPVNFSFFRITRKVRISYPPIVRGAFKF